MKSWFLGNSITLVGSAFAGLILVTLHHAFQGLADTMPSETVSTFDAMWNHPMRNLERIERHFGEAALRNMMSNLSRSVIVSLYSGLGGAEAVGWGPGWGDPKLDCIMFVTHQSPVTQLMCVSFSPVSVKFKRDPLSWQLATMSNYNAVVRYCHRKRWPIPPRPRLLLACDVEPTCQKVIQSHEARINLNN